MIVLRGERDLQIVSPLRRKNRFAMLCVTVFMFQRNGQVYHHEVFELDST